MPMDIRHESNHTRQVGVGTGTVQSEAGALHTLNDKRIFSEILVQGKQRNTKPAQVFSYPQQASAPYFSELCLESSG